MHFPNSPIHTLVPPLPGSSSSLISSPGNSTSSSRHSSQPIASMVAPVMIPEHRAPLLYTLYTWCHYKLSLRHFVCVCFLSEVVKKYSGCGCVLPHPVGHSVLMVRHLECPQLIHKWKVPHLRSQNSFPLPALHFGPCVVRVHNLAALVQSEKVELKCFSRSIQSASGPQLRKDPSDKPRLLLLLGLIFSFPLMLVWF